MAADAICHGDKTLNKQGWGMGMRVELGGGGEEKLEKVMCFRVNTSKEH